MIGRMNENGLVEYAGKTAGPAVAGCAPAVSGAAFVPPGITGKIAWPGEYR